MKRSKVARIARLLRSPARKAASAIDSSLLAEVGFTQTRLFYAGLAFRGGVAQA